MRKITFLSLTILIGLMGSCSSDDNPDPMNNEVTYSGTIKPLMEGKCTSCHGDPVLNGAPMSLITLEQVKEAIQNRNLVSRVESGSMPPGNITLSDSEIQSIKDWAANDFPE